MSWWQETYEHLRVRREADGVAVLVLDLPERRNMMSEAMTASWRRAVAGVARDREVRCVVVSGAGSAFSSGGDLAWIGGDPGAPVERLRARMDAFYRDWLSVADLEVPTVAAVSGSAIGAGLALALACDLRFVAEDARLSVPFTRLGMHPGMLATWSLPRVAGVAVARDLLLTGRAIDGVEAVRLGIASRALPAGEVLSVALETARGIAANAPAATRLTKLALAGEGHADRDAAIRWEALAQAVTLASEDLQEGLAAQRERRPARFTGR
jgi:enoyl-CoA hydratase